MISFTLCILKFCLFDRGLNHFNLCHLSKFNESKILSPACQIYQNYYPILNSLLFHSYSLIISYTAQTTTKFPTNKDQHMFESGGITDLQTAKAIARKLFQNYNQSTEGSLPSSAMQRLMADTYKIMNKQFRPMQQDILVCNSVLDFNKDGNVTLEDFQNLAIKFLVKNETRNYTKKVKERLQVAKRLFDKFDKDKSGYLSESEIPDLLRETYSMMGVEYNPTQEDTQSWMEMTDLDGDGKVTLEDYQKLIIESLAKCGVRIYERD